MNSQVLNVIVEQLNTIIENNGFTPNETGDTFKNDNMVFRIVHNEEKKMLCLDIAEVKEGSEELDFQNASSWLFEEEENLRDAESAGLDFLDTLKGKLGIRGVRTGKSGEVVLPRNNSSSDVNIDSLTAKILAVFPQLKDVYKEEVSKYGAFLYLDFYKNFVTPKFGELIDQNNKKTLKKVVSMLEEMFCEGDRTVSNVVVGIILGGACRNNKERYETILTYTEDMPYLTPTFKSLMPFVNSNKKFKEIFGE